MLIRANKKALAFAKLEEMGFIFTGGEWSIPATWCETVKQAPLSERTKNVLLRYFDNKASLIEYIENGRRLICLANCGRKTTIEILEWLDLMSKKSFQVDV